MKIELISKKNFNENSLDSFDRSQKVIREYRKVDEEYILVNNLYVMDWSLEKKRNVAKEISGDGYITYLAIDNGLVIGFIGLNRHLVGTRMILDVMQVSKMYRRQGLGRILFEKGVKVAETIGAKELYISSNSSEDTVAFYKKMGAEITDNPIQEIVDDEPYDLQMTLKVSGKKIEN
jgi:N-acetylglutamate synthase-like GNAT family acetyltransferase